MMEDCPQIQRKMPLEYLNGYWLINWLKVKEPLPYLKAINIMKYQCLEDFFVTIKVDYVGPATHVLIIHNN